MWLGSARTLQDELPPLGKFAVFQEEADQASELSGVFWGGVELVLELETSVSILELSSSSRAISLLSCFILCSCAILRFSNSISLSS